MEGRYAICSGRMGMEQQATQATLVSEDCFICAGPICYTEPAGIYANTASIGLPPRRGIEALSEAIEIWRTGCAEAAGYDDLVNRARRQFASVVGTVPARVAMRRPCDR